jgi:tungstate transport system permease protein
MVGGASRLRALPHLLAIERTHLLAATLARFGRTISAVGGILLVGGNVAGCTRTMTTAIVLETSEGNLSLALGLGFVLIGINIAVSTAIFALGMRGDRGDNKGGVLVWLVFWLVRYVALEPQNHCV